MKITTAKLTKAKLAAMPAKERTLLLLMGHVVNEINVFQKLMLMVRKGDAGTKVVDLVEAGQALIFLRTLIGKLHEASVLLDNRVHNDEKLKERYGLTGRDDLGKAFERLTEFLGKWGKLLAAVRNNVSFHSWDKGGLIEKSFAALSDDEPWDFYLSESHANSFYYASEMVVTRSAIGLTAAAKAAPTSKEAEAKGLAELFDAMLKGARLVSIFFVAMMVEIIDKCVEEGLETEEVEIGAVPKMSETDLPFFFEEEDLRGLGSTGGHIRE